jgi:hypothetical protein
MEQKWVKRSGRGWLSKESHVQTKPSSEPIKSPLRFVECIPQHAAGKGHVFLLLELAHDFT